MKFYSETLQASFNDAKPILESLSSIKDAIYEDIKELEAFLQTIHLNESFHFNLKAQSPLSRNEELLVWNHVSKRIIYIENRYGISCVSHDKGYYYPRINFDDKQTLIEKPLIDTDFEIRKRVWQEGKLALFLSFITQRLNINESI
jgi:hypothetical protein